MILNCEFKGEEPISGKHLNSKMYTNLLYLGDFFEFLDLEPGGTIRFSVDSRTDAAAAWASQAR